MTISTEPEPMDNIFTIKSGDISRTMLVAAGQNAVESLGSRVCGFDVFAGDGFVRNMLIEENAEADILVLVLPGQDANLDLRIEMAGQGASCRLFGLYLCPDNERLSVNVGLVHKVGRCKSHQLFKGIVSGTSRTSFYGRIVVDSDAQVTEAYQENHNLLLSDTAKVDTMPQLEIYADDVKCSHGATIGKLNEDEQFYMRSRGIPESEAKVLQMVSFISPVLDILPDGEEKTRLASYVEHCVRTGF